MLHPTRHSTTPHVPHFHPYTKSSLHTAEARLRGPGQHATAPVPRFHPSSLHAAEARIRGLEQKTTAQARWIRATRVDLESAQDRAATSQSENDRLRGVVGRMEGMMARMEAAGEEQATVVWDMRETNDSLLASKHYMERLHDFMSKQSSSQEEVLVASQTQLLASQEELIDIKSTLGNQTRQIARLKSDVIYYQRGAFRRGVASGIASSLAATAPTSASAAVAANATVAANAAVAANADSSSSDSD